MLDNYRDLIDQLIGTPAEVRAVVDGELSPEKTALLIELRDRDELVLAQLQELMRAREPFLRAALPAAVRDETPASVLTQFESARGEVVSLLMNLTLRDWEKAAIHETDGEITLVDLVETHADFDEDHLTRLQSAT